MTEFKIDLGPAMKRAEDKAKRELESNLEHTASSIVRSLLANGRYDGKEGLAHEILRKKVEDYVLSDAFNSKLDACIEEAAGEEIMNAVRTLINSKTRKALFEATA